MSCSSIRSKDPSDNGQLATGQLAARGNFYLTSFSERKDCRPEEALEEDKRQLHINKPRPLKRNQKEKEKKKEMKGRKELEDIFTKVELNESGKKVPLREQWCLSEM